MLMQRVQGLGRLVFADKADACAPRLQELYQEGAARIRVLRSLSDVAQATLINTAGGLTADDRLEWRIALGKGVSADIATAAYEKAYRAVGGHAALATRLHVAADARLDWLPQETILFEGSALKRRLDADLDANAALLAVEAVLIGRAAMRETLHDLHFHDRWRIRRAGRLVHADDVKLEGDIADWGRNAALLAGGGAMASVVFVSPDAQEYLPRVRDVVSPRSGASAFDGRLICRIVADNGMELRQKLLPILLALRNNRPLPRAWMM